MITQKRKNEMFKIFKSEVEKWIGFFGLFQYSYEFFNDELIDTYAEVNFEGDMISIIQSTLFDIPDEKIKLVAFHEVCEILLNNVGELIRINVGEVVERREVHKIIRILENTVFNTFNVKRGRKS